MLSNELAVELRKLSRADKLQVLQILINDLAAEEPEPLAPDAQYDVWSPFDAPGAAEALTKLLEEDENVRHGRHD